LDADDTLLPTAIERAVALFLEGGVAKAHWPLIVVNAEGSPTGQVRPGGELPEGDLRALVIEAGPDSYEHPPTTGNAWARAFLREVFPIPEVEKEYGIGDASADAYLSTLAPLFGHVRRISEPQGCYRLHGQNEYAAASFDHRLRRGLLTYDVRCAALGLYCQKLGIRADSEAWKAASWIHRLRRATEEMDAVIPRAEPFILVDDDIWGMEASAHRRPIPLLERDGQYGGHPADDATAIRELERLRQSGAAFIAFLWPGHWWLDYYSGFREHLRARFPCVVANGGLVLFDLRRPLAASTAPSARQ